MPHWRMTALFVSSKQRSSPYINHFIQPDTIIPNPTSPQAWNRYSYVGNRPVNANDPSGDDKSLLGIAEDLDQHADDVNLDVVSNLKSNLLVDGGGRGWSVGGMGSVFSFYRGSMCECNPCIYSRSHYRRLYLLPI